MLYATVDTFDLDRGAAALALGLCKAAAAGLTGFLVNLDANAPTSAASRSLDQVRDNYRVRAEANTINADALVGRASGLGVSARTVTGIDHSRGIIGCMVDHARLHDVLVIGTDSAGLMSDRLVAESALFETGRPMLVAPATFSGDFAARRICVAWDNSRVAARALGDALAVLPGVEEVALLTVGGEKAVDSCLSGQEAAAVLARGGLAVSAVERELDGRSIGDALQDGSADLGADVLVMGGYGHSRLRDFILGGATLSVLGDPRLPVLLSH